MRDWGLSWGGWLDNRRGEWWLLGQLVLIAMDIALPAWPLRWSSPQGLMVVGVVVLIAGLVLAAAAFVQLGSSLTPLPEPMPKAELKAQGLYGFCRHPLYLAVLVCALGMALIKGGVLHPLLLLGLTVLLRGKAKREEQALLRHYPDYGAYQQRVPAFFPGL
ncbi:MAG: methyltransferase family protein [Prochlorococcaceae cyanobacterium]